MLYKVLLYVDSFDIEKGNQKEIKEIPENINDKKEIKIKTDDIFEKICREILNKDVNSNPDIKVYEDSLTARYFINNIFKGKSENCFDMFDVLKRQCKTKGEYFLVKGQIDVESRDFTLTEKESKERFIDDNVDWKTLYKKMPVSKRKEEESLKDEEKSTKKKGDEETSKKKGEDKEENLLKKKKKRIQYSKEDLKDMPEDIKKYFMEIADSLPTGSNKEAEKYLTFKGYSKEDH
ncbi:MAG: hypothetical protein MJ252_13035 [archaeon]|nr:hypothetical protein [archaeon]